MEEPLTFFRKLFWLGESMSLQDLWYNEKIQGALQVLAVVIIVFILISAGLVLFSPDQVNSESLSRSVGQKLVYVDSPISVTAEVPPVSFPECRIGQNIVIAIDRSSSMNENSGFQLAIESIDRFIQNFDLTDQQIGIVFFSDTSEIAQPLTNDIDLIAATLYGQFADGLTDLSEGLQTAINEVQSVTPQNKKTIILLTDAADHVQDSGSMIREIVDQARRANVQIIAIGLGDVDRNFINLLASDVSLVHIAPTFAELDQIFSEVILQVSNQAASEMVIFEEINPDQFEVVQGSLEPSAGFITSDGISWRNLSASYAGLQISYQLLPKTSGWLKTATHTAPVRFRACDGEMITLETDLSGPRVMVIPDWLIYLIPLLLLLLALAFWPRRKPIVYDPPKQAGNFTLPAFAVEWPSGTQRVNEDPISDLSTYPTLVIGLGQTGNYGLQLLKKALLDRGERKLPDDVRILWIGEQKDQVPVPFNGSPLMGEEIRIVDPNLNDISNRIKNDQKTFSHINWWRPTFDNQSRAFGRVSLFWEFEFDRDIRILDDIKKAATQLSRSGGKTQLLILGSLSDKWASAISDLAYLARLYTAERINQSLAFLAIPCKGESEALSDDSARRGAAARELSRFVSGKEQLFHYQFKGKKLSPNFLFDSTFLSDKGKISDPEYSTDLVLDGIVDQMLSLMEKDVASTFWQNLGLDKGVNAIGNARDYYTLVGTINNYNYWWPVEYIRSGIEALLVDQVLLVQSAEKGDSGSFEWRKKALQFLRHQDGAFKQFEEPFHYIADAVEGTWPYVVESADIPPVNLLDGFRWKLILYLNELVEDRSSRSGVKVPKNLRRIVEFLEGLASVLDESKEVLLSYSNEPGNGHVAEFLHEKMPQLIKVVSNAQDEVRLWMDQFRTKPLARQGGRRQFSSEQTEDIESAQTIGRLIRETYQQKSRDLDELSSYYQKSFHKKVIIKRSGGELDFMKDYFEPYLENNTGDPLEQLSDRFGWYWDQDKDRRMRLRFAFLPPAADGQDHSLMKYFTKREELDQAWLIDIFGYARILSRSIRTNMKVTDYLEDIDHGNQQTSEIKNITDLLEFERGAGAFYKTRHYLISPETVFAEGWKKDLADPRISVLPTKDPSRLTYLEIYQNLPLSSVTQIRKDLNEGYYPDPDLHAYFAEQYAASLEKRFGLKGIERFNPRFIRLMDNPDLFEAAMRCLLYGWIRREKDVDDKRHWFLYLGDEGERINLYGTGIIEPETLEDALQDLILTIPIDIRDQTHPLSIKKLPKTMEQIRLALDQMRKTLSDDGFKRIEARKEYWRGELGSSDVRFDQDLLRYLLLIADEELL